MAESIPLKIDDKIDGCVITKTKELDDETKKIIFVDDNHNHQQQDQTNNNGDDCPSSKHDENGDYETTTTTKTEDNDDNYEPVYSPKISLPLTETKTLEDDEEVIVNLRARIYRYITVDEEPEFKERGTGTVKILQHKQTGMYRVLMRREKTFKICANHYITGSMKLNKHNNSEKVFLYSTLADFYENETNPETFAIRFSNAENAAIFKEAFDEAVEFMIEKETIEKEETTELANEMEKIQLNQKQPSSTTNETNGDDTKKE